jgi:uncharacterized protein (TIRG00374 family)
MKIGKLSKLFPIIGIVVFIYILINIGAEKIVDAFISIPPLYYILASLLFIPRLIVYVYKWQFICKKQRMNFGFWYLSKIYLISMFYGNITPAGIGYNIRIYYLKEKGQTSWGKVITNTLLDATTGFVAGIFLALVGSLILIEYFPGLFTIMVLFFILYLVIFVVLMKKERGNKIFNTLLKPLIPSRFKEKIGKSVDSLYEDMPLLRDMVFPILLECVINVIAASQGYIIALAFSINVPFIQFVLIAVIASVVSSLPITVGGLGIREGATMVLLSVYGVLPEVAFAISLSGYFVKQIVPSVVGWIISIKEPIDYRNQ